MAFHTFAVRALVASSALVWAGSAYAQTPSTQDLVGTWNLTLTSPQGTHPTTMTIRDEAGQLAGAVTGLPGTTPVAVKTSEAGVTMSFSVEYEGQPLPVVMTGKITGTDMKGTVDYASGAAAGDFSGSKAGAAAATPVAAAGGSLTGAWAVTGGGGGGYSFKFTQEGTAVSGALVTPDGAELPLKGTFANNVLDLAVTADGANGTVKGTLEGETLTGTYDIGGNAGSWSAARKP
jgi:hypothetical protein